MPAPQSRNPFGDSPPSIDPRLIRLGIIVALIGWALLSSYYTVPTESEGVILRFGRYNGSQPPGLHFKLPFGIDQLTVVPVQRQLKLEFGFGSPGGTNSDQTGDDPDQEKAMVTGDLNAALVEWVVQYRVDDPRLFLFHVANPGSTLRDLSESVMREVVGDRTVDEVITIGRQDIEVSALERLRTLAKEYQLGVAVDQVQLKNVNPPREVQASFNEVNKAQQDRENAINIANGDYNKAVPRAQGEAAQRISQAEGYKLKRVNEALGDVSAFQSVFAQYLKAPEVTRTRLYLETMADVLPRVRQRLIVDEAVKQIYPLLPGGNPVAVPTPTNRP
jgi:membrane protease subunit HflK